MFSSIKKTLGIVDVSSTPKYITVEGIETFILLKDMYRIWGSNQVGNQMFSVIQSGKLRFLHFFALDFKYICEKLLDDPQTRSSRRVLAKIIHELKEKTWVGDVEREVKSITNEKDLDHLVPFPLKPFQREFVRHVGKLVPAYRLRGYMLDAGAGTGKTVTQLILAHCLGAKKCIVIVPKNSAERVWQDTIAHIMLMKKPYWVSTDGKPLTTDAYYYVVHYEQLQQMLDFVKAHPRDFEGSYLGLDESHNFNRIASDRTQAFIDLAGMPQMMMNLWASGTPIQALGVECIPFLKCIDPMFNDEAEERFRKIYGRDAKRANDILRNRIGHLKYHVPKQDVVDIPIHTQTVLVKMPNAHEYTLEAIGEKMRKFIMEREAFYEKHKAEFKADYERALTYFEQHAHFNKADYAAYKAAVALISKGFDPKLMKAEAQLANSFERKVIIPTLPNTMKEDFRKAKSVVKYVNLTIMGECLGTILGGSRSKCHLEMVENIDFSMLIDGAVKKTLIFTSFVEVLERAASLIDQKGYQTARVYGATNKDLSKIVKDFYENDDINPLLATYPSLSTAVPLTVASRILMINQPFRDAIRTQTIARAARLGQDTAVDVVDLLLDTGDKPNISTRSNDIMQWSAEMTASILGVANVDLDSMQLESKNLLLNELIEYAEESFDNQWLGGPAAPVSVKQEFVEPMTNLPPYLFHSSAYKQNELKPGFKHSGVLVKWDKTEDNTWLYAADKKDEAIMLGISSAIEKKWDLSRYKYDAKTRRLDIEVCDQTITKADIEKLSVYIYTLRPEAEDGWVENFNPVNGLKGEYKTQGTIHDNILRCETVDVHAALRGYTINIKQVAGESFESLGDIITDIKKWFQGPSQKDIHKEAIPRDDYPIAEQKKVDEYLKQFFGNPTWVKKQQFNTEVAAAGIVQPLSYEGKFNASTAFSDIEKGIAGFIQQAGSYSALLKQTDDKVQATFTKYEGPLTKAIHAGNHDEVEKLCADANKEFDLIGKHHPAQQAIGKKYVFMGGWNPAIVKSNNAYGMEVRPGKEHKVEGVTKIPALNAEQIGKAVAIIDQCFQNIKGQKGALHFGWLDFEAEDVWSLLQDFDEPLYMDYAEHWYHQRVSEELEYGFPYYNRWYSDIIIALLHWMDRSVK